jgi:predicted Zn-dependent protease with MMP-like domain
MMPPSRAEIEQIAQRVIEDLPPAFVPHLGHVRLVVSDFPDAEVERAMDLDSAWDLLGLYQGHGPGSPEANETGALPPMILLYRRPILAAWVESDDSLEDWVRHVLIHEIGHHFGLSDAAIAAVERRPDP